MRNRPSYAIESVDNALCLLLLLRRRGGIRLSEAADELGVARSTAHRLLAMLRYRGFAVQDDQRVYRPGDVLNEMSSAADDGTVMALCASAHPHLERLSDLVGESVNLMVQAGTYVRFIDTVETTQILRVGDRTGMTLPAHRTSGGKAMLAALPVPELDALYPPDATEPPDGTWLRRVIAATRRRGYGVNFEESETGVTAIGVPIRWHDLPAAITVAAPTARFRRRQILTLLPHLRTTARMLEATGTGGSDFD